MADLHYYISATRGNDTNDGLSADTAWATITQAVNSVVANPDGNVYIHIAPGTYREKLTIINEGIDTDHRIIFQGDPERINFPLEHQGDVRLTGTDINNLSTTGDIITLGTKKYIEFWKLIIDGTTGWGVSGGDPSQIIRKCTILQTSAAYNTTLYDCTVYGGSYDTANGCLSHCTVYNTIIIGAGIINNCTCYNCMALGAEFYASTVYNSITLGSYVGFDSCTSYNCYGAYCTTAFSGGTLTNCKYHCCSSQLAMTGLATSGPALFDIKISNWLNYGLKNNGTLNYNSGGAITFPITDSLGLKRVIGSSIDIGPIEDQNAILDWDNYKYNPPGIRVTGEGQVAFQFPVEANRPIVKSVWVKYSNTSETLRPEIIIDGLGEHYVKTCSFPVDIWVQVPIYFTPSKSGVMRLILYARDPAPGAYTIFSDPC